VTTVVIADAQPHIRHMLGLLFAREGYSARIVSDGLEALELVRSEHPRLVILDANLTTMDGYHVCRSIKADATVEPKPHLLMLTADGQDIDRQNAKSAGFDEFRFIPFSPSSLMRHVRRTIGDP
jgi:DNA-binding response OmpR family regulator